MKKTEISTTRNAIMAVIQALVSSGILFLLYRFLLLTVGIEQVGVWAIVLATASASRISELGFTGSAVKFTARYVALGKMDKAAEVVQTTYITIGLVLICALVAGYPLISWIVVRLVSGSQGSIALGILPVALLSVWISVVSGVFLAALDGCQRVDLRATIVIVSGFVFLTLTWILVPGYGLYGLAWAQVGQGVSILLGSRMVLQRELPSLRWFPWGWRSSLFKEMFQYGVNFQLVTIFSFLFEPTSKALMAVFGGLSATAYYEMANRMVIQFRQLLVSANQVMIPKVAFLQEREPREIQRVYLETFQVVSFLALPLFSGVVAITPLVSEIWLGSYQQGFALLALLLTAGWWINTHNVPAYFFNMGKGSMRWNTLGQMTTGVLNIVLGYWLGSAFGGTGVVLGFVVSLTVGSSIIVVRYHSDNRIPFRMLLPPENKQLAISCLLGLLMGAMVFHYSAISGNGLIKAGMGSVVFILTVVPSLWVHPLRVTISGRIANVLETQIMGRQ